MKKKMKLYPFRQLFLHVRMLFVTTSCFVLLRDSQNVRVFGSGVRRTSIMPVAE